MRGKYSTTVHDIVHCPGTLPNVSTWKICLLVIAKDFLQHWLHSVSENTADDLVVAVQEGDWSEVSDDPLVLVLLGDQYYDTFSLLT